MPGSYGFVPEILVGFGKVFHPIWVYLDILVHLGLFPAFLNVFDKVI